MPDANRDSNPNEESESQDAEAPDQNSATPEGATNQAAQTPGEARGSQDLNIPETTDQAGRADSGEAGCETPESPTPSGRDTRKYERASALGTLIAAIAAVVALVFSGIATLYSVEVSKDQLQNSREDDEKEAQAQATRVNVWTDTDLVGKRWGDFDHFIYIENRSADTAYSPVVYFDILEHNESKPAEKGKRKTLTFAVGRFLPACTRMKIKSQMIVDQLYNFSHDKKLTGRSMWGGAGINFYDTSGLVWDRFSGDRTDPPKLKRIEKLRKVTNWAFTTWYLEELRQVGAVQKSSNCGVD
ncbi:hypothetical protein [Streptomyces sp. AcH 505]|uniref:hypothetical protein n=1 Tax=Streptomyces sp. AcH 505 TaxID=352211 RepID=UPI0012FEB690